MNFLAFALIIFGLTQIEIAKIDYHAQCTSDSGCSATQYCKNNFDFLTKTIK